VWQAERKGGELVARLLESSWLKDAERGRGACFSSLPGGARVGPQPILCGEKQPDRVAAAEPITCDAPAWKNTYK
jgi:hypothetical protein